MNATQKLHEIGQRSSGTNQDAEHTCAMSKPEQHISLAGEILFPPYTFPVDGVVLGYIAEESPQKPSCRSKAFAMRKCIIRKR